ncbi:MAG: hypothetical protein JO323_16875 [Acidobacteriia bacterium]|nr:hypothetical protein [Terriglobia bacterium]
MGKSLKERCDAIEECYEFMLAYAAQGLPGDGDNQSGAQVRHLLERSVDALTGLADAYASEAREADLQPAARYDAFLAVLRRDANDSLAALELVLAQPVLSSQLIDNLNASMHLRALLTDLFLIDEIVKQQRTHAPSGEAQPS